MLLIYDWSGQGKKACVCRFTLVVAVAIFSANEQSLRRLCFTPVILFKGRSSTVGGVFIQEVGGMHPGWDLHIRGFCIQRPLWQISPCPIGYYEIRSTSGWYASYCNAFLLSQFRLDIRSQLYSADHCIRHSADHCIRHSVGHYISD